MDSRRKLDNRETFAGAPDLSLLHLLAELARIDILIQRQVDRWRQAGQDPNDDFRGLYVSDGEAQTLLKRPIGMNWGDTASLEPDQEKYYVEAEAQAKLRAKLLCVQAQREGARLRLPALVSAFHLSSFEVDALLICLAPYLDLRYERLYGYLQDDVTRKHPTINLLLNLLSSPGLSRLGQQAQIHSEAPLFKHHLLGKQKDSTQGASNPLNHTLILDETIVHWLLGYYHPQAELARGFHFTEPAMNAEDALFAGRNGSISLTTTDAILIFSGVDQVAKRAAARLAAARSGLPLLEVDLLCLNSETNSTSLILELALRDARLTGAILYLAGWDASLENAAKPARMLSGIFEHEGPVILDLTHASQLEKVDGQRPLFFFKFPYPDTEQRQILWEHFLKQESGEANDDPTPSREDLSLLLLADQFRLSTAQIRASVSMAKDHARQSGAQLEQADLQAAARAQSSARLSHLARKITPHYTWEDIVLPDEQHEMLREIISTVRERGRVLEAWGLGQKLVSSQGVTMLFAGPPGTGKTMAAEVIAAELGLDLYKIDLSTIVSKYIGETEKNLEQIFTEATNSNAILFFDEADALFGKRSEVRDAHDRYANIEISYLLQRMESYDGVTILATNLRANLDEAFTRRLQFAVDFPFPDEADRLRIWRALFPPALPHDPDLNLAFLAQRFKLSGGSIRNILISTAYLAAADGGQVTMEHLLHGTRREMQKMGKIVEGLEARVKD